MKAAAGGQERKVLAHLPLDIGTGSPEDRAQAPIEAELLSVRPDEVEDGAGGLPGKLP